VIFQRTELGNAEIRQQRLNLPRVVRLTLVLVDGVSEFDYLKKQLSTVDHALLDNAVEELLEQALIYEVMYPNDGDERDVVESEYLEAFLKPNSRDRDDRLESSGAPTSFSGMISGNERLGISVDTRKQTVATMVSDNPDIDMYLPLDLEKAVDPDVLSAKLNRKRVSLEEAQQTNRRKRRRRKKTDEKKAWNWRLIGYSILLVISVLVIGFAVHQRLS
jgi:hypothetical protein